jgi:argininosuccinate lyase
MISKKKILENVYSSNPSFLFDYFNSLNNINNIFCKNLKKKGYLSFGEFNKILEFSIILKKNNYKNLIKKNYIRGYYFEFENFLKKKIGNTISDKIHIGRSRNDLDATISKIIIKKNLKQTLGAQILLIEKLNNKFSSNETLFPFYTQNQFSSFLSVKHYFNSNILSFIDYTKRSLTNNNFINECPLGACGLNGTSINLDYENISKELGFKNVQLNSHRSVTEYEYFISYINDLNLTVIKWSRILQDFQILHNENNKIIKFNKEFYARSSFYPHKQNIFLIEYALSLCTQLCEYSNLSINLLRKSINSNSFEVKSIIQIGYKYFLQFSNFLDLIDYIISNISFNKVDIFDKKYDQLYLTYFQNYILMQNKKSSFRKINNKIFNEMMSGLSLGEIINKNIMYSKNKFFKKDLIQIKKLLLNANSYGRGPQDPKVINSAQLLKKITLLKKKVKFNIAK